MNKFIKGTFAAFIILFALSGIFTVTGSITRLAVYGTFKEGNDAFYSEWDAAMKHFSDHFSRFAITRNGIVYSNDKKALIKYQDQFWRYYPTEKMRFMVHVFRTDLHIIESDTDEVKVTVRGNINYRVKMSNETLSIEPAAGSYAGFGPKSEMTVEIPAGLIFSSISLYADHGNIDADTLIAINANIVADHGDISIDNALVADQELTGDIRYGSFYANCINTTRIDLQATASAVTAGVTDRIYRLHAFLYSSEMDLTLPWSVKSKTMDVEINETRFSRYDISYE